MNRLKQLFLSALLVCGLASGYAQNITGRITAHGKGVEGVVVSDGMEVTRTDKQGRYELQSDKVNGYVFYSLPRGYEPLRSRGFMPRFWAPLMSRDKARNEVHNFELTRQEGGADRHVMLFGADIHLSRNNDDLKQFEGFLTALEREQELAGTRPLHTLFLGDISWDAYWTSRQFGLPELVDFLEEKKYPAPLWGVMGNHDHDPSIREGDATDFLTAGVWRNLMGPNYYSFNLGHAHYVVLDDIVYKNEDKGEKYKKGIVGSRNYDGYITPEQFAWLEKDLAAVKDKNAPLIISVHIPVWRLDYNTLGTRPGLKKGATEKLSDLVRDFKQVHIMSGHLHINYTAHPDAYPNITEHNLGALSACWWKTGYFAGLHLCQDGSPGGYLRWEVDKKDVKYTYCSFDKGESDQMRLYDMNSVAARYRNDAFFREMLEKDPKRTDYSATPANAVLANVYAYDTDWKVEFLEDGKPLPVTRLTDEDPMSALFLEESDGKLNSKYKTHHLFQAVATTPDHPVTVRVSDSFGRVYSQTLQRPRPYAIDADYTRYVNPFIGNAATGHTFPGATVPFGLVQATPATGAVGWQYCSNYVYGDKRIWGFVQTALNGTGCVDLGNILVMPVTARPNRQDYHSDFDNATEQAAPGYYSVYLKETGVKAEMTATPHVAYHRYTFDRADSAGLYVNLQHSPVWGEAQYHSHVRACEVKRVDDHTLTGYLRNAVWVDKEVFFVMTFNRPMTDMTDLPLQEKERGNRMLFSFDMKPGQQLEVKVALSSATVEGAMRNMKAELPGWGFEQVRRRADNQWNNYLSRIQVEGTDEQKTNFYTSFYHALIQPNNIADVDGMYRNPKGELAKAEGGTYFSTFSTWDTYRAAHPFYTLMVPEMVSPFVRSMISHAEVAGYLPIWTLWGKENHCMIGNHSVPIIAEAYAKGFRGFDAERAWNAVKMTQTVPHQPKSNWDNYMKYGYFPTDLTATESVSTTLECGYDDYAASVMARLMGKKEDAAYFEKRAGFYKNLFDKETRFMRPRLSDGSWKTPFDPSSLGHAETGGGDYTEGNAWQYTWHVQHDVPGLINLFGGPKPFLAKLDSVFTVKLNSTLSDVTGLIGQYAHGNEPSHHVTYLYALAGRPERTQELIREIFDTQYLSKPDGLCGNDDCGQMSAWYMFSAMGFYPVNPVCGEYVFGAPQLPSITLQLPGGKTFTIRAEGLSKENLYVDKIYLNGKRYTKPFIRHEDIMKGGTLVFKMKK